jgi:methylmalonyl-CoA mutase N-terminal domain/subunit
VENGYFQREVADAAYKFQKSVEQGDTIVVGVNKYGSDRTDVPAVLKVDPQMEKKQVARVQNLRKKRNAKKHQEALELLRTAVRTNLNIVEPVIAAVENFATVGEISDVFRKEWKEFHEKL